MKAHCMHCGQLVDLWHHRNGADCNGDTVWVLGVHENDGHYCQGSEEQPHPDDVVKTEEPNDD